MKALKPRLVESKKKNTSRKKTAAKRGAQKMREAADKIIGRDSRKIAQALSRNGQKGQLPSIKFMYELSEAGVATDDQDDARKIRSMALELASAPQWTGPLPSETDDEDAGE